LSALLFEAFYGHVSAPLRLSRLLVKKCNDEIVCSVFPSIKAGSKLSSTCPECPDRVTVEPAMRQRTLLWPEHGTPWAAQTRQFLLSCDGPSVKSSELS